MSRSSTSPTFSGKPTLTQADRAHHRLRDLLVTLAIPPGEPLREAALMEELGVGRTPLREACNRLATDRLVDIHPRRGTFATHVDIADLALLTEVRLAVEGLAAERAAERATAADRRHLEQLVAQPADTDDPHAAMRHDAAIHRAVWAAGHNPFLVEVAERHHALSTRIWYLFVDRLDDVAHHVDELGSLVGHVLAGRTDEAGATARGHVRRFEHAVRALW